MIFLNKNIFCDPSLEPSQGDGSNESQHLFLLRIKLSLNYPQYPLLSESLYLPIHILLEYDTFSLHPHGQTISLFSCWLCNFQSISGLNAVPYQLQPDLHPNCFLLFFSNASIFSSFRHSFKLLRAFLKSTLLV